MTTMTTMAAMAIITTVSPSSFITTSSPSSFITTSSPSALIAASTSTTGNDSNVASHVSGQNTTRGQAGGIKHENRDATHRV
jgi:hypothetical protein